MNQATSAVSDWIVLPPQIPVNGRLLLGVVNMRMSLTSPTVPTVPPLEVVGKVLSLELLVRLLMATGAGQLPVQGEANGVPGMPPSIYLK